MFKKVLTIMTISMLTTILLALIILATINIVSLDGTKNYTIVTGKVVAKADFDLKSNDNEKRDNRLFIVFKVDDKYIRLNANIVMFNNTKIGDIIELKRIIYKPKIGEEQIYYDYN